MAAPMLDPFEGWLSEKLLNLNSEVDLEVFVSYIISILDTESNDEDATEALVGFLAEITEDDVEGQVQTIVNKWKSLHDSQSQAAAQAQDQEPDLVNQFHTLLEQQHSSQKLATKTQTAEEKARKAAIMAQYATVSDGEQTDSGEDEGATAGPDIQKVDNTSAIGQREQELRERMKREHEGKKQKDKEDREKQKQKATDRKDAEKKRTQKGERRR